MQDVSERVKNLLVEIFNVAPDNLNEHTSLRSDLDSDSLDAVEFIMAVEDEFAIEINDGDFEKMTTFGDIISYVEKRLD
jgi:acyl carrier protein